MAFLTVSFFSKSRNSSFRYLFANIFSLEEVTSLLEETQARKCRWSLLHFVLLCLSSGSSCFNGGTCLDGVNSYTCHCRAGFTGTHCQHEIDECQSQPCLNGGVCHDGVQSYRCTCPQGYTGPQCQVIFSKAQVKGMQIIYIFRV